MPADALAVLDAIAPEQIPAAIVRLSARLVAIPREEPAPPRRWPSSSSPYILGRAGEVLEAPLFPPTASPKHLGLDPAVLPQGCGEGSPASSSLTSSVLPPP